MVEGNSESSDQDRHKALQYLQKCNRCLTQAANWEKDVETCKFILTESVDLSQKIQSVASELQDKAQASQFISSARLMFKSSLTKVTRQHTDPATGKLLDDLAESCTRMEQE